MGSRYIEGITLINYITLGRLHNNVFYLTEICNIQRGQRIYISVKTTSLYITINICNYTLHNISNNFI